MVRILAHRGVHDIFRENSMESFMEIEKYKPDENVHQFGLEFDIQLTNDGEIVCYHDKTLERIHNNAKEVTELTLKELEDYKIPKLVDVLSFFKCGSYFLDIEVKSYFNNENEKEIICQDLISLISEHNLKDNCVITSFDKDIISICRKLDKSINSFMIFNKDNLDLLNEYLKNDATNGIVIDKKLVSKLKDLSLINLELMLYTFHSDTSDPDEDKIIINTIRKYPNVRLITDNIANCIPDIS